MPDVNEENTPTVVNNYFVPGEKMGERSASEGMAEAFLALKIQEERQRQADLQETRAQRKPEYPHADGSHTVLGPEIFTDGAVICWKGQNYVPQEQLQVLRDLRTVCSIHLRAMVELMEDKGIHLPDNALRLFLLLNDELTLTMPALAESHPAVLPRLPEGME